MKSLSDNIKPLLALILVVGCLSYLFMITFLFRGDSNVLSQALIAIVTALSTATGYYFGYSQGAARKDDVIAAQSSTPTATTESGDINVKK